MQPKKHKCLYNVINALIQAHYSIEKRQIYNWGEIHIKRYSHNLYSFTPLKMLFERYSYVGGNKYSLDATCQNSDLSSFMAANYRAIYDLDDENGKSYWIIDTGVSGDVFSPYYDNLIGKFDRGEYLEMNYGHKNIEKNTYLKLDLKFDETQINKLEVADRKSVV